MATHRLDFLIKKKGYKREQYLVWSLAINSRCSPWW